MQRESDMKYIVYWNAWGTGELCKAGPFDTIAEADVYPYRQLYGPMSGTVKVYQIEEKEK